MFFEKDKTHVLLLDSELDILFGIYFSDLQVSTSGLVTFNSAHNLGKEGHSKNRIHPLWWDINYALHPRYVYFSSLIIKHL